MGEMRPAEIAELLEKERGKLHWLVKKYGLASPLVLEQSKLIDSLLLALLAAEKQVGVDESY